MLIKLKPAWLLSDAECKALRAGAKFWRTIRTTTKKPVTCRACGSTILSKTDAFSFKHFALKARMYDRVGFVHADEKLCGQLRVENDIVTDLTAFQTSLADELLQEQPDIVGVPLEEL